MCHWNKIPFEITRSKIDPTNFRSKTLVLSSVLSANKNPQIFRDKSECQMRDADSKKKWRGMIWTKNNGKKVEGSKKQNNCLSVERKTTSMAFQCDHCSSSFTRLDNMRRHIKSFHTGNPRVYPCYICGEVFNNYSEMRKHRGVHKPKSQYEMRQKALNETCRIYEKKFK